MKLVTCHYCNAEFLPSLLFGFRISACCSDECTAGEVERLKIFEKKLETQTVIG